MGEIVTANRRRNIHLEKVQAPRVSTAVLTGLVSIRRRARRRVSPRHSGRPKCRNWAGNGERAGRPACAPTVVGDGRSRRRTARIGPAKDATRSRRCSRARLGLGRPAWSVPKGSPYRTESRKCAIVSSLLPTSGHNPNYPLVRSEGKNETEKINGATH